MLPARDATSAPPVADDPIPPRPGPGLVFQGNAGPPAERTVCVTLPGYLAEQLREVVHRRRTRTAHFLLHILHRHRDEDGKPVFTLRPEEITRSRWTRHSGLCRSSWPAASPADPS